MTYPLQVRRTFARTPDAETVDAMWQRLAHSGGSARMAQTIEYIERLAREIPCTRFETWDDLGHWPQIEGPSRVAATASAF